MLKNKTFILLLLFFNEIQAQKLDSFTAIAVDTTKNIKITEIFLHRENEGEANKAAITDTVWHQEILYLVNKKGIETGETKLGRKMFPCRGYLHFIFKTSFLTRYMTTYESCTGKWYSIDYYFLDVKTKTKRNPVFSGRDYKAHKAVGLRSKKKLILSME